MAKNGKGDLDFMLAVAAGAAIRDSARRAGIGERTAYRRAADIKFQSQVQRLRREMLDRTIGRVADAGTEAVDSLRSLLQSADERVKLAAAKVLVDKSLRIREVDRLLEQKVLTRQEALAFMDELYAAVRDNVHHQQTRRDIVTRFQSSASRYL